VHWTPNCYMLYAIKFVNFSATTSSVFFMTVHTLYYTGLKVNWM
jgi:hypothetical protein